MKEEIIIVNKNFNNTVRSMVAAGPEKFHVLADFDRTLTRALAANGSEIPSLISVLRDEGYLTPNYPVKAKELFNYYHTIEIDPLVPYAEKKKAMYEWWSKHFQLLIASHLNKKDIAQAVLSQQVRLRDGAKEFLEFLSFKKIPLIIMSASGLGKEAISIYLQNQKCFFNNIYIISNEFIWDEDGFAVAVKQPIIHSLNKDETVLKDFTFFKILANRKNVLLLGDNPDDIKMITGFDFEHLIKVGFLNKPNLDNRKIYEQNYDLLIINDGSMEKVNAILKNVF
ncbi:MAG TPA: hypothetical protein PKZ16_00525 [bacterium]|nr:hypothetical protein [bacterium]HPL95718.1 hypothetical protein [bacterium]